MRPRTMLGTVQNRSQSGSMSSAADTVARRKNISLIGLELGRSELEKTFTINLLVHYATKQVSPHAIYLKLK